MKTTEFFDRLIERFDQLDPASVQGYLLKLVREKGVLETIFQTIHEGVLIIDRERNIHFVNNSAMSLLGLPPDIRERQDPRIDRYLRDLDWDQIMAQDPSEWQRASRQEIEVMYPEHRYLQFYLLPYQSEMQDDKLNLVAIVLRDITDLRKSAESTIESEKLNAITMLAAGVAHEIGNPLNSLMIHLQLLERGFKRPTPPGPEDVIEHLRVAMEEVRRLDTIINQFLKAIRPSPLDLSPLNIPDLISKTLAVMKAEIENRGVTVECEWSDRVPSILGDEGQLKQVFYNVINNAVQAMPDGGALIITVTSSDTMLEIDFQDSGQGIPPGELNNIFNSYYTTKSEGTGLGLVIVERIVREHGGRIAIESEEGQGTEFTITLPRQVRRTRLLEASPPDHVVEPNP